MQHRQPSSASARDHAGSVRASIPGAALVAASVVLGGCSASRTVTVGEADNGRLVDLALGDTLKVELPANPTTGYSWEVAGDPGPVLAPLGAWEFNHDRTDLVGAPGLSILRLRAASGGAVALRLGYRRPWEDPATAAQTWQIDVSVK
ncbi:MAG TPA: protease inhibitor I42 family protein [Phycisphaerales bacterium]|nr:protease inhibitor I42 family protein [Phycisphaerales bacterium]HMP35987.1 protease inhibitor I42 family protein [Phycisphaerales bacterium]